MTGCKLKHERINVNGCEYDTFVTDTRPLGYILIQPSGAHEADGIADEAAYIAGHTDKGFVLAVCTVDDWNRELSPWKARAAFGSEDFGGGASVTLERVLALTDGIRSHYGTDDTARVILGGYSLAGLFSLWSGHVSGRFDAVAAVSPSVWFEGWCDFAAKNKPCADAVYLSLGIREEKTRNPMLETVGECIRRQYEILCGHGIDCTLEWNEGGHFCDADVRTAKGFVWCMERT